MKKHLLFYCLFSLPLVLIAQKINENDTITQLDEVILLDALKKKNATGSTDSEIISAKIFQNYSPVSMVNSINQVPGIYIFSGALNTNRITIRGIGARTLFGTDKLSLYYNDIPVTDGSGFSTIEAYDLENLSQIEIIKGPKGTAFGANLGGAIILTPKKALGRSTNFSNNATIGSFGLVKNNLSFNHFNGKFRIGLQYGHLKTDGYRENSKFKREGLLLNSSYKINNHQQISLLVNHVDYTSQIPSSIGATAFAANPKQAAANWAAVAGFEANNYTLIGLNYSRTFNKHLKNNTSVFYTYLDHFEKRPRPLGFLDENTMGFGFRTRFSAAFKILNKLSNFSLGGEMYKDEYDWDGFETLENVDNSGSLKGEQFTRNKEFRDKWNIFGSLFVPITENFSSQLGFNINKTTYDYRDLFNFNDSNKSAKRSFKAIFLPSLNLKYLFSDNFSLFANISRGFSNPTLEETLTPDGAINPKIAQETGSSYELGSTIFLLERQLKITASIYQMNIKNLLVGERINEDQFVGKNAGKTRHKGLEIGINYAFTLGKNIEISPFLNFTLTDHSFVQFTDKGQDFSGNPLTGVPKTRNTIGVQSNFLDHFYWNITTQYVGSITLTNAADIRSDSFNTYNSRMGYQQKLSTHFTLGFDFGVNNIFNTIYAQSVLINTRGFGGREPRYFYPGDARNYYASFRLGYRL